MIIKAACPSDTCDLAHRPGGGGGPQKGVHTPLFLRAGDPVRRPLHNYLLAAMIVEEESDKVKRIFTETY